MQRRTILVLLAILLTGFGVALLKPPLFFSDVESENSKHSSEAGVVAKPAESGSTLGVSPQGVAPSVSPKADSAPNGELLPREQAQMKALSEIFTSRNDNDPRIDTELKDFSPAMKHALATRYARITAEKRNEKGTIVFLLGREISSKEDVGFLKEVLLEKPCMSLQDCSKAPAAEAGADEHLDTINETTIRYPQLMAIRALRAKALELKSAGGKEPELLASIIQALNDASQSSDPRISDEARSLAKELESP
jgi:hypothetical protein